MHFAKNIYFSDNLIRKKKRILRDLKYKKKPVTYFVIFKNENTGKYEFMHGIFFMQKRLHSYPFEIAGIVNSYDEALLWLAEYASSLNGAVLMKDDRFED